MSPRCSAATNWLFTKHTLTWQPGSRDACPLVHMTYNSPDKDVHLKMETCLCSSYIYVISTLTYKCELLQLEPIKKLQIVAFYFFHMTAALLHTGQQHSS